MQFFSGRSKAFTTLLAVGAAAGVGVAAASGARFLLWGGGNSGAVLSCPGGLTSLEHVFDESNSMFEGDPETHISLAATVEVDYYQVEAVELGTHTGTHLDAPGHFIEGGRFVDELTPEELIMPAYVIDVRDRMSGDQPVDFQLSANDIMEYEKKNGRIRRGSLVIIRTGFDEYFGTEAYDAAAPGFSGDAVQWLVDKRDVGGIGSDTYGPDASSDEDYMATYTILLNDRVAVPGLNNLESLATRGDIVMLSPVRLGDGSGFQVNPVACHGRGH